MIPDLPETFLAVRNLVLAAGTHLMDHYGNVRSVSVKQATELLTEVDGQVEALLLDGLGELFPGDAVLGEETGETKGHTERRWIVDPLDGTTNYAHGHPFFSVSVACADAQGLLWGFVLAPYLDEMYQAIRGRGAWLDRPRTGESELCGPLEPVAMDSALLGTGFPYVRGELVDRNTQLVATFLKEGCHGVRRGGSAALDLAHVAAGKLDGFWEYRLRPWDTAAGTLIAREAGALVTSFDGRAEPMHHHNILAAAPGLHERMQTFLVDADPDPAPRTDPEAS